MNGRTIGILGALGATLAWGGQFPVFGSVLQHLDPFWLTAIRGAACSVVLLAVLVLFEGPRALSLGARPWLLAALGALGFTVFGILLLVGVGMSGAQHGALIMATTPLLAALVNWARTGRRPAAMTLGFTLLAFAGVALVVTRGNVATLLGGGSALGDLLILGGAFAWAIYTLEAPAFGAWSPLRFSALTVALGTLGLFAMTALATLVGAAHVPTHAALIAALPGMAYLVLVGQAFAIFAWTLGIKHLGSTRAVLFMNAVPIVTFAIEIALGAHFHPVEYIGAAITIGALVLNNVLTNTVQPLCPGGTSASVSRVQNA